MALKATIFKATLEIADMDRHYYGTHHLTIARHPSETDQRMMVRLLAFALNASEQLQFTKGLSTDDEPDLWLKNYSEEIELWIDLGLPEEKRLRKACGRAKQVLLYCYGGRQAEIWWEGIQGKLGRFDNLTVINLPQQATQSLAELVERTMQLNVTIQDGAAWVSSEQGSVEITPESWRSS